MDAATATSLVKAFAATDQEPTLEEADIALILTQSLRPDSSGNAVGSPSYTPNYDANYAISQAWEMKAGRAAGKYTFLAGGNQFIRSDMIRHCQQMADRWRRGVFGSIPLVSSSFENYRKNYLTYWNVVIPDVAS